MLNFSVQSHFLVRKSHFSIFRLGFFILFFTLTSAQGKDNREKIAHRDLYLLQARTLEELNQKIVNDSFGSKTGLRYDPMLFTMAAGLESRGYHREEDHCWELKNLAYPEAFHNLQSQTKILAKSRYYYSKLCGHYRFGTPGAKKLFIILGSSFSSWKRGTWTHKTVSLINDIFPGSHFLALAGYLDDENLKSTPLFPELNGDFVAQDLYLRIRTLLHQKEFRDIREIGVIGFSGGASIAISLLKMDAKTTQEANQNSSSFLKSREIFNLGGIAFSPVLDVNTANHTLDKQVDYLVKNKLIGRDEGLTTLGTVLLNIFSDFSHEAVLSMLEVKQASDTSMLAKIAHLKALFINEFVAVDLRNFSQSSQSMDFKWNDNADQISEPFLPLHEGNRYDHYYRRYTFEKHKKIFPDIVNGRSFAEYTNLFPDANNITQPLTIVFAEDDPVLSRPSIEGMHSSLSPAVTATIRNFQSMKNVDIFTPNFGGHMGYYLDTPWLKKLLEEKFSSDSE